MRAFIHKLGCYTMSRIQNPFFSDSRSSWTHFPPVMPWMGAIAGRIRTIHDPAGKRFTDENQFWFVWVVAHRHCPSIRVFSAASISAQEGARQRWSKPSLLMAISALPSGENWTNVNPLPCPGSATTLRCAATSQR